MQQKDKVESHVQEHSEETLHIEDQRNGAILHDSFFQIFTEEIFATK